MICRSVAICNHNLFLPLSIVLCPVVLPSSIWWQQRHSTLAFGPYQHLATFSIQQLQSSAVFSNEFQQIFSKFSSIINSSPFVFLTNWLDYHSLVLFCYIWQQLAAVQTGAVKSFCTDAASKPKNKFHYLGLQWNCTFQTSIASIEAYSKSTSLSSIIATSISAYFPVVTVNPTPPIIQLISTSQVPKSLLALSIIVFAAIYKYWH